MLVPRTLNTSCSSTRKSLQNLALSLFLFSTNGEGKIEMLMTNYRSLPRSFVILVIS